jgi:CubicO group peptidase (beta-lactamase class C family)
VEEGIIGLDDPVSKYLPEYKNAFLIKDGKPVPATRTMTIRHLFTMSAGLDYNKTAKPVQDVIAANPHTGNVELVNAFIRSPLQFEPGDKFLYSLCHDVLAAVVEVASGMRFAEYLKKTIFDPLGMKDTSFRLKEEDKSRLAAQYYAEPEKFYSIPQSCEYQLTDHYESGGAGLYSTVEDYSLFADAMANGGVGITGKQILKPETIDLMRSEQLTKFAKDPEFSCWGGPGYGYGLGVRTMVDPSQCQHAYVGEFGWDGAAGSFVLIDPTNNLSIFFATHVMAWPNLIGKGHIPLRDLTYECLGL